MPNLTIVVVQVGLMVERVEVQAMNVRLNHFHTALADLANVFTFGLCHLLRFAPKERQDAAGKDVDVCVSH